MGTELTTAKAKFMIGQLRTGNSAIEAHGLSSSFNKLLGQPSAPTSANAKGLGLH